MDVVAKRDKIYLDGTGTEQQPFEHCQEKPISHCVTITSYNGRSHIQCSRTDNIISAIFQFSRLLGDTLDNDAECEVTIEGIVFVKGYIMGNDIELLIKNCHFEEEATIYIMVDVMVNFTRRVDTYLYDHEYE